jgi:hypothetical protein
MKSSISFEQKVNKQPNETWLNAYRRYLRDSAPADERNASEWGEVWDEFSTMGLDRLTEFNNRAVVQHEGESRAKAVLRTLIATRDK